MRLCVVRWLGHRVRRAAVMLARLELRLERDGRWFV